jgi:hypothetical protein
MNLLESASFLFKEKQFKKYVPHPEIMYIFVGKKLSVNLHERFANMKVKYSKNKTKHFLFNKGNMSFS